MWPTLCFAVRKFSEIDGEQWAAAFAHYAFFSLFPLIVLFVTVASIFVDREQAATAIIAYVKTFVPIDGDKQSFIFDTVSGVVNARGQAGVVAFLMLGWSALSFFSTLIRATNRAWDAEAHHWWRLPLKSLVFLACMIAVVLVGIAFPLMTKMVLAGLFPVDDFSSWVYALSGFFIPLVVVFLSFSLFYKLAPSRRTRFVEVWAGALSATLLLQAAASLFGIYLKHFASLNAVYGAFGGIMALLLWIYFSGCIFIFGACLCAGQVAVNSTPAIAIGACKPK